MNGITIGAILTAARDCHALAEPDRWRENGGIVPVQAGERVTLVGVASVWVQRADGTRVEVRVEDVRRA